MDNERLEKISEKIDVLQKEFEERLADLRNELASALKDEETRYQAPIEGTSCKGEYVMSLEDNIYDFRKISRGVVIAGFNTKFEGGDIVIPTKIGEYTVVEVQEDAFKGCDDITGVKIANGITVIREKSFAYSNYIKTLEIPETVTVIEDNAFAGCNSLIEVTLPGSIKSIGEKAFYHCESLASVYIPKSVESIGKNAFYMDNELKVYCEAESKPEGWDENWLGTGLTPEKKRKKAVWGM